MDEIKRILVESGYDVLKDCPGDTLCIVDPTCVWPPLLEFIHTAWIVLTVVTAFLLIGWAVTMLRGANHDMVKNLRSLFLIFGTLSVALPAVNVLGMGRAIVNHCETIKISHAQVEELLKIRNQSMQQQETEHFDIRDSNFDDLDSDFNF
ncbi:MAG: hypothetical protein MJ164_01720 [Alphaproteobacteria bacterium]|nr:hypothetical protein [Alphaproteobacteria bacterium]